MGCATEETPGSQQRRNDLGVVLGDGHLGIGVPEDYWDGKMDGQGEMGGSCFRDVVPAGLLPSLLSELLRTVVPFGASQQVPEVPNPGPDSGNGLVSLSVAMIQHPAKNHLRGKMVYWAHNSRSQPFVVGKPRRQDLTRLVTSTVKGRERTDACMLSSLSIRLHSPEPKLGECRPERAGSSHITYYNQVW